MLASEDQGVQVDSRVDTQPIEQVNHIFRGDVTAGALGVRAAAEARDGAVEYRDSFKQAGVDVGHGLAVGVVEVPGQFVPWHDGGNHVEHLAGGARGAGANGVAQGYLVAAHGVEFAGDPGHLFRCDVTFIGAAQHTGHVTTHGHAVLSGRLHDRHETLQAFADRAIDVALGKRSEAAANTATSLTPEAMASSNPRRLGASAP